MKNIDIKQSQALKCVDFPPYSNRTLLPWPLVNMTLQLPGIAVQPLHNITPSFPHHFNREKKKVSNEIWCTCVLQWTLLPWGWIFGEKKSGENGLITAVTFYLQPRGLAVGLKDSPSLPPLLPSAMSHLRFTGSALQLLEPTGHRGQISKTWFWHRMIENSERKTKVRVKGYMQRGGG